MLINSRKKGTVISSRDDSHLCVVDLQHKLCELYATEEWKTKVQTVVPCLVGNQRDMQFKIIVTSLGF